MYRERLEFLRKRNNIKLEDIATILNIDLSCYGHYEKEDTIIPLKHLNTVCSYFNVSLDYIFGFTNILNYEDNKKEIDKKEAGIRLKEFRKENNLTQVKLASILNTVHPTITNYENGKHLIATPFLYEICKRYSVSADYLLGKVNTNNLK